MTNEMSSKGGPAEPVCIGVGNALHLAPFNTFWQETVQHANWQMIEGRQDELNAKLAAGELDIAFISSFSYGQNARRYKLLPGLSLSISTAAGVAILFSHVPLDQLGDSRLLLETQAVSSAALVRILLEEWNEAVPEYVFGESRDCQENCEDCKAVLATGDDALRLIDTSDYLYQFDLGDIWKREMELPFVFLVCAVRREFCEQYPQEVQKIYREFLRCRDEGVADMARLCELSANRVPVSTEKCRKYLEEMEYDFSGKKRASLEKFLRILIERKDLEETALPLEFFTGDSDE